MSSDSALQHSFATCENITRTRARNFFYGLKLAPEPKRSALFALYAWMRTGDDLVDEDRHLSDDQLASRIAQFRQQTDAALSGQLRDADLDKVDHSWWIAFSHTAQHYQLEAEYFHDMLRGQLRDVEQQSYATFDDLKQYCYEVASTVGLLCVSIWGYADESALELAVDRGIAFQLTNILRDFAEDFDRGCVYLPHESFTSHELTPGSLRHWESPQRCNAFWKEQIALAQSYYDRSRALIDLINTDCRPVLWAMTTIYESLLKKLATNPQRTVIGKRMKLSPLRKSMIAIEARRMSKSNQGDST